MDSWQDEDRIYTIVERVLDLIFQVYIKGYLREILNNLQYKGKSHEHLRKRTNIRCILL